MLLLDGTLENHAMKTAGNESQNCCIKSMLAIESESPLIKLSFAGSLSMRSNTCRFLSRLANARLRRTKWKTSAGKIICTPTRESPELNVTYGREPPKTKRPPQAVSNTSAPQVTPSGSQAPSMKIIIGRFSMFGEKEIGLAVSKSFRM